MGLDCAMATNDLINSLGGKSANFLDIGWKATASTLLKALEILEKDSRVEGVWINIFGGMYTRSWIISEGADKEQVLFRVI